MIQCLLINICIKKNIIYIALMHHLLIQRTVTLTAQPSMKWYFKIMSVYQRQILYQKDSH